MTGNRITEEVSRLEAELNHLRGVTQAQAETIEMLKRQNSELSEDCAGMTARHESELRTVRLETDDTIRAMREKLDTAERQAMDVKNVLDVVVKGAVAGLHAWNGTKPAAPEAEPGWRTQLDATKTLAGPSNANGAR